jgi:hypothetical protein
MTNTKAHIQLPAPHKRNWRDWNEAQPEFLSTDSRFEQRLSTPQDFPEIYTLLHSVFEDSRSHAAYDWIYEQNPYGKARCELIIEKSSGQIVSTSARFPWPLMKGDQELELTQGGDSATLKRLQRQGLYSLRKTFEQSHPWYNKHINLGLPNSLSRAASRKYNLPSAELAMPFAKKILDWQGFLIGKGVSSYLAKTVAPVGKFITRTFVHLPSDHKIEPIVRFSHEHQSLSLKLSRSEGYWCPHGAQWMNWRYFSHPSKKYVAHGLYSRDGLKAFGVIRLDSEKAMLMELVSPDRQSSRALLNEIERAALESGAKTIETYASSCWQHWPALNQQRYFKRPSNIFVTTRSVDIADVSHPKNWTILPGDSDVF